MEWYLSSSALEIGSAEDRFVLHSEVVDPIATKIKIHQNEQNIVKRNCNFIIFIFHNL